MISAQPTDAAASSARRRPGLYRRARAAAGRAGSRRSSTILASPRRRAPEHAVPADAGDHRAAVGRLLGFRAVRRPLPIRTCGRRTPALTRLSRHTRAARSETATPLDVPSGGRGRRRDGGRRVTGTAGDPARFAGGGGGIRGGHGGGDFYAGDGSERRPRVPTSAAVGARQPIEPSDPKRSR